MGSAGRQRVKKTQATGAPPPLPRKDPLPMAARPYSSGKVRASNVRGSIGKVRPSSAPLSNQKSSANALAHVNAKPRMGVAAATTASSSAKRRGGAAMHAHTNQNDATGDEGRAALQELLRTYKNKAERELSTVGNMSGGQVQQGAVRAGNRYR